MARIYFSDGEFSSIHIESFKEARAKKMLLDAEVVVVPTPEIEIKFSYPMTVPKVVVRKSDTGFTLLDIAKIVHEEYVKIYREEDETKKHQEAHGGGLLNRGDSDGKYGIWGHDLGDLYLEGAAIKSVSGGRTRLDIMIGS